MTAGAGHSSSARKARSGRVGSLIANYSAMPGVYDEMVDANGRPRPHWAEFIAQLDGLGATELGRRFEVADRSLRDSGVFYRVYNQADGGERAWPLSHVPLLMAEGEWKTLVAGLIQRARLLEAVLQDAYGPGKLVSEGIIPAAALAGSPEFLRPMVGIEPLGGRHLRIYAVDLGRGPDGKWWVLGDRTQAPSGAGYALENRLALSRALPDVYRSLHVERLAPFFQAFRAGLTSQVQREDARLGLLTPGPLNETYFEHAYLARYLGFLLVEGGDLTVRDGTVYIRTVAGLKRADALLRRLDGDFADPLELNARSHIGVAGLVDAVRHGTVLVANSLGSGLAESRALMSFLPALGGAVLGESLALPNVATWWCGQPAEREVVKAGLDRMAVAPAFGARLPGFPSSFGAVLGARLDAKARRDLLELIDRRGVDVVGQEVVKLSTMPVWNKGKLEPRPFILRVFVAATPEGWTVMPGGFCRISNDKDARAVTMQQGGSSADVWVLADAPVPESSLLPTADRMPVRRTTGALPSRAADNLFWLGRYLERAEATLRLVRAMTGRLGDVGTSDRISHRVVALLEGLDAVPVGLALTNHAGAAAAALARRDLGGTVPVLVENARRTASVIRDRLSPDAWRVLTETEALFAGNDPLPILVEGDAFERSNAALTMIAAFSGLAQENMNRSTGWHFMEVGRRLERALATSMFVRHFAVPNASARWLDILLELADSQITYRTRYILAAARAPVVDLVTLDPGNPRSVAFQVEAMVDHLATLPGLDDGGLISEPVRIAKRLQAELVTADAASLSIDELIGIEGRLMELSNEISHRYFTHRNLPGSTWDSLG